VVLSIHREFVVATRWGRVVLLLVKAPSCGDFCLATAAVADSRIGGWAPHDLRVGDEVDCRDASGAWWTASVMRVSEHGVVVRFSGADTPSWEEEVGFESDRLARCGSQVPAAATVVVHQGEEWAITEREIVESVAHN